MSLMTLPAIYHIFYNDNHPSNLLFHSMALPKINPPAPSPLPPPPQLVNNDHSLNTRDNNNVIFQKKNKNDIFCIVCNGQKREVNVIFHTKL